MNTIANKLFKDDLWETKMGREWEWGGEHGDQLFL